VHHRIFIAATYWSSAAATIIVDDTFSTCYRGFIGSVWDAILWRLLSATCIIYLLCSPPPKSSRLRWRRTSQRLGCCHPWQQFTLSHVVHGLGIAFGHFITSSTTTKQWLPYIAQKFKHASRNGKFLTNCNYDKDYYCMDLIIIFYYSYDKYTFYLFFSVCWESW